MTEASFGAPFSTTVRPAGLLDGVRLPSVHGVEAAELRQGQHLLQFLRTISEHVSPGAGSSDEEHDLASTFPAPVFSSSACAAGSSQWAA